MVYLRCLFNVIFAHPIKTGIILLCSISSTLFLAHKEKGLELVGLGSESRLPKISFVTTLDSNFQELRNKIIVLPGVKKVEHKTSETIKEKISLLFKSDVLKEVISDGPGYNKFTIYFKPNVTLKSVNLIKSYVIKILSGREVYFGKVIDYQSKKRFDKNQIFYFIYSSLLLILLSFYTLFEINLRKLTYLFQRFQRNNGLQYKVSFLSFVLLVIIPKMSTLTFYNKISINNIIAFCVPSFIFFFIINLKKYRWSS